MLQCRLRHPAAMLLARCVGNVAEVDGPQFGTKRTLDDGRLVFAKERKGVASKGSSELRELPKAVMDQLEQLGPQGDTFVYGKLLKACSTAKALHEGRHVHEHIAKSGMDRETYLGNLLMRMYGSCNRPEDARSVFNKISKKNVYSWNIMVSAYAQNGHIQEALKVFDEIPEPSVVARNTMIGAYAQNGKVEDAKRIFDKMPVRDVASWNSMIAAYAQNGHRRDAVELYWKVCMEGVKADHITFMNCLDALRAPSEGRQVHSNIVESGYELHVKVGTAIVNMHARCGNLQDARSIFERMPEKDVIMWTTMITMYAQNGDLQEAEGLFEAMPRKDAVAWTAMLAAYAQNGHCREALRLFRHMDMEGVYPTCVTFISVLDACASIPALAEGRIIHSNIVTGGTEVDGAVESALLHMYGKCGSLRDAKAVFDSMSYRNVVSWSGIVAAHAQNGHGKEALELFHCMHLDGVLPDEITFISVLHVCGHAGLSAYGRQYFLSMTGDWGLRLIADHYVCMVDVLGRSGQLEQAEDLIANMPFHPNEVAWTILLNACKMHGDVERAQHVSKQLLKLNAAGNDWTYVLLSNIHAAAGNECDAANVTEGQIGYLDP